MWTSQLALALLLLPAVALCIPIAMQRAPPRNATEHIVGQTLKLNGGIVTGGEYFIQIQVGGQSFMVHADTGSSTLAIPDTACLNCDSIPDQPPYDRTRSTQYAPIPCSDSRCTSGVCSTTDRLLCGFSITYGDGSGVDGSVATDVVSFGGHLSAVVPFGRILQKRGQWWVEGQAAGILGLAYSDLNCDPSCFKTPLDIMAAQGLVTNKFAMCLNSYGGVLDLGDVEPSRAVGPIRYVDVLRSGRSYEFYTIRLLGSSLGDAPINALYSNRVIVDSGTTLLIVAYDWFNNFREKLRAHPGVLPSDVDVLFGGEGCSSTLTLSAVRAYPPLTFQLENGVSVTLQPTDYLVRLESEGLWCLGIQASSFFILGDVFMQTSYVVFDQVNNKVGFAPVNREQCSITASTPSGPSRPPSPVGHNETDASLDSMDSSSITGVALGALGMLALVAIIFVGYRVRRRQHRFVPVASSDVDVPAPPAIVSMVSIAPEAEPEGEGHPISIPGLVTTIKAQLDRPAVLETDVELAPLTVQGSDSESQLNEVVQAASEQEPLTTGVPPSDESL